MGGATRGGARRGCRSGGGVASTATTSRRATAGDPGRPCVRNRLALERRYPTSGRLYPTSLCRRRRPPPTPSAAATAPAAPRSRRARPRPRRRRRLARARRASRAVPRRRWSGVAAGRVFTRPPRPTGHGGRRGVAAVAHVRGRRARRCAWSARGVPPPAHPRRGDGSIRCTTRCWTRGCWCVGRRSGSPPGGRPPSTVATTRHGQNRKGQHSSAGYDRWIHGQPQTRTRMGARRCPRAGDGSKRQTGGRRRHAAVPPSAFTPPCLHLPHPTHPRVTRPSRPRWDSPHTPWARGCTRCQRAGPPPAARPPRTAPAGRGW